MDGLRKIMRPRHAQDPVTFIKGEYFLSPSVSTWCNNMKIKSLFRSGITDGRRVWTIPFLVLFGSFLADFLPAQAPPPEPLRPLRQSAPQQLSPRKTQYTSRPHRTLSGRTRRIDPARFDRPVRCGARRALYRFKWRSGAGREPTVGRKRQVARPLSGCSKMDGSKPRVDDRCGRGFS